MFLSYISEVDFSYTSRDDETKHSLLPEAYRCARDILGVMALPRRHREASEWYREAPPVQTLIEAAKQRTRRLLTPSDELEREVWGCASEDNSFTSQTKVAVEPLWLGPYDVGEECWNHWESTLTQARKVQVPENCLTDEFREARRIGLERDPYIDLNDWTMEAKWTARNWGYYELRHLSRHKWGQYLRSNMDWDWDLGSCMKRLFKIEKQTRVGPSPDMQTPPASSSGIDVDAGTEGTLNLSMGEAQGSLPREVKVTYKTATGETQILTFAPLSPIPGNTSVSERPCIVEPSAEDWSRKSTFEGRQEIDDPEAGSSSLDISLDNAFEDSLVEETRNDY